VGECASWDIGSSELSDGLLLNVNAVSLTNGIRRRMI
jgi:hypothetical protein